MLSFSIWRLDTQVEDLAPSFGGVRGLVLGAKDVPVAGIPCLTFSTNDCTSMGGFHIQRFPSSINVSCQTAPQSGWFPASDMCSRSLTLKEAGALAASRLLVFF